jgi:hypothetical protein
MGRFMSPDPIKITEDRLVNPANTLNLYSYAANNPLKYVDPDGDVALHLTAARQQENIEQTGKQLELLKEQRRKTEHHITLAQLLEEQRFQRLIPERMHFIDTIKMISYRAETSMASVLREVMARSDDVRALLCQVYHTEADLLRQNFRSRWRLWRCVYLADFSTFAKLRPLGLMVLEGEQYGVESWRILRHHDGSGNRSRFR